MSRQLDEEDLRRIDRAIRTALRQAASAEGASEADVWYLENEILDVQEMNAFLRSDYDEEFLLLADALEAMLLATRIAADRVAGCRDQDEQAAAFGRKTSGLWEMASNALSDRHGPWTTVRMMQTAAGLVIRFEDCRASA